MRSVKNIALGLLFLPLTLATLWRLPAALLSLQSRMNALALIVSGALAYALVEALFQRPMRTYVFGHELTHALASMAMGGKVHSFNVSAKGGSVSLSKTNFIVALAPYCVPIYTLFVLLAYWAFRKFHSFAHLGTAFFVLVGMTLAFHASLTLYAVRQDQPDLKRTGTFFSVIFIALVNAWVLAGLSKILFWDSFASKSFAWGVLRTQADIWAWIWAMGGNLVEFIHSRMRPT